MKTSILPSKSIANIHDDDALLNHVGSQFHVCKSLQQEERLSEETKRRMTMTSLSFSANGKLANLAGQNDFRSGFYARQIATRVTYHNYTGVQIVVYERDGVPLLLKPDGRTSGYDEPCVVIKKDYIFEEKEDVIRTLAAIKSLGELSSFDLKQIKAQLEKDIKSVGIYGYRLETEYKINASEMNNSGGTIYHRKTDAIISILPLDQVPKHPHSSEAIYLSEFRGVLADPKDELNILLRYVDHDDSAQPLYINFANKVFELRPQKDHPDKTVIAGKNQANLTERPSNSYIEFIHTDFTSDGFSYVRFSPENDKAAYGIFDSYGEAINVRASLENTIRQQKQLIDSLEAAHKSAINKLEKEHADAISDYKDKMRVKENTIINKDAKIADLQRDSDNRNEYIKYKREDQTHQQKTTFEVVKFAISVMTMLIGIIPLVLKLKQKT